MMVVFMTVAAVNVALYSTTILFYIRGKSFRMWIHRINLLSKAGLDWNSGGQALHNVH
jgi:hypothetical protein